MAYMTSREKIEIVKQVIQELLNQGPGIAEQSPDDLFMTVHEAVASYGFTPDDVMLEPEDVAKFRDNLLFKSRKPVAAAAKPASTPMAVGAGQSPTPATKSIATRTAQTVKKGSMPIKASPPAPLQPLVKAAEAEGKSMFTRRGQVRRWGRPDAATRAAIQRGDNAKYAAAKGMREAVTPIRRASDALQPNMPLAVRPTPGMPARGAQSYEAFKQSKRVLVTPPPPPPPFLATRGPGGARSIVPSRVTDTVKAASTSLPPSVGFGGRILSGVKQAAAYPLKHPVRALGGLMTLGYAADTVMDLTGVTRNYEARRRQEERDHQRAMAPTVEDTLRQMEIQELIRKKEQRLMRGDRDLYYLLARMPQTTRNEAVVGAKPDTGRVREFLAADALARGEARREDFPGGMPDTDWETVGE